MSRQQFNAACSQSTLLYRIISTLHSVYAKFVGINLLTTGKAAWYISSRASACMSVKITFESLDIGSSFSHIWYIFREFG